MKLKSKRSLRYRFRVTKSGHFKKSGASKRHLATGKKRKRKRQLRKSSLVAPSDAAALRRMLPYG